MMYDVKYDELIYAWSSLILKNFGYFKNSNGLVQKEKQMVHVGKVNKNLEEGLIMPLQTHFKDKLYFNSNEFIVESFEDPYTKDICETISFPVLDKNFNKRYFVLNPTGKMFSIRDSHGKYDFELMEELKIDATRFSRFERTFENKMIDLVPNKYLKDFCLTKQQYNSKIKKVLNNSNQSEA